MRWLAFLLLIVNVLYLGWEFDRETKARAANSSPAFKIPAGATTLKTFDELADPPALRSASSQSESYQTLLPIHR